MSTPTVLERLAAYFADSVVDGDDRSRLRLPPCNKEHAGMDAVIDSIAAMLKAKKSPDGRFYEIPGGVDALGFMGLDVRTQKVRSYDFNIGCAAGMEEVAKRLLVDAQDAFGKGRDEEARQLRALSKRFDEEGGKKRRRAQAIMDCAPGEEAPF